MSRSGAPTRAARVHAELRADILAGRLTPGARLPFAELSARYGMSMGVIREALTRLTAEGLVESEPQYGFRVTPVSVEDLRHLTEARLAIETLVLRQAFAQGGVAWESSVLAAHHRLERTPQMTGDDPARLADEWVAAHNAYHLALLSGCPNPRLLAMAASLRDSAELYRRWSVPLGREHRDIAGEHHALLDAVLAQDADAAAALLAAHIQHTTDVLLERSAAEIDAAGL
ncbi:GntR family transcriptional regulator [Actinacidiphila sp. DG2A-62]|uniref:GntR family transcriptional regulator n=1 Tax=Actinacidiphila sp. DG2A-62 TaxID=3108821 RepID=UPI002DBB09CB|nr:GntR family transcriptional regulator [Actinacidiphila sp. DG2A-62]MEC3993752.1 GntR family transcriptional regulator [Actinacidiphila sp. DG2A-62]